MRLQQNEDRARNAKLPAISRRSMLVMPPTIHKLLADIYNVGPEAPPTDHPMHSVSIQKQKLQKAKIQKGLIRCKRAIIMNQEYHVLLKLHHGLFTGY